MGRLGGSVVSVLLVVVALSSLLGLGAKDSINLLTRRRGLPFHDANSAMVCSSFFSKMLLLHILCARWTRDLSHAVFRHHGVKLEGWTYWPVCVNLR